jgi:8-oxo-dGTP pyrophosphatase MutT (NUDIX family)
VNEDKAVPRPASTVVLLREEGAKFQVYLLKRSSQSGFFPDNYVFPGGTVDSGDRAAQFWLDHVDLNLEEIERGLGGSLAAEEAVSYSVAAIRETFEEAGVFLGRKRDGTGPDNGPVCENRVAGRPAAKGWLREWVVLNDYVLSFSCLVRWTHWITPEAFRPRFDTRFFLAFMPEGQECSPDTRETTHGIWVQPRVALEKNMIGDLPLTPPTLVTLQELLEFKSFKNLGEKILVRSWSEARLPRLVKLSKGAIIVEPWDPMIGEDIRLDEEKLNDLVLPVGTPFSRLWLHKGVWRPVGNSAARPDA